MRPSFRISLGKMRTRHSSALQALALLLWLILGGCAPVATPTLFVPPTEGIHSPAPAPTSIQASPELSPTPGPLAIPTVIPPTPTPPCTNGLTYNQDLTIPDGSNFTPGQSIVKEWQVTNSGSCNWDDRYRLKLVGGDAMGANPLQALYPARAGTQVTLRIVFTAPQATGLYQSQWQAVDPDGQPFGDAFYMSIAVAP